MTPYDLQPMPMFNANINVAKQKAMVLYGCVAMIFMRL